MNKQRDSPLDGVVKDSFHEAESKSWGSLTVVWCIHNETYFLCMTSFSCIMILRYMHIAKHISSSFLKVTKSNLSVWIYPWCFYAHEILGITELVLVL